MKRVLILAYYFPPCNMPGANRPYGWAKYLHKFGYYPIIITRRWDHEIKNPIDILRTTGKDIIHEKTDEFEVFYLPYKQSYRDYLYVKYGENKFVFIRRLLTLAELLLRNYSSFVIPYRNIYSFADSFLSKNKDVKLLITTGAPFTLFKFSHLLNKKHGITWIADYRDDWNTSGFSFEFRKTNKLLKAIEHASEQKWLRSAIFHTAVSPYSVFKNSHFLNKHGFTVHNGYFFEDILNYEPYKLYDELTISFIGTLYSTQKIEIFLDGFIAFVEKNNREVNIKLLFPGLAYDLVQKQRIENYLKGYELFFEITERIPKENITEIENRTHAFLYCAHDVRGVIGSKIYEYVGLKKSVIFCPSDNDIIENIFTETGVGIICNDSDSVSTAIERLYNEFSKSKSYCPKVNDEKISFYSRLSQAGALANVFNTALDGAVSTIEKIKEKNAANEFSFPEVNEKALAFYTKENQSPLFCNYLKREKKVLILAYDFPPYVSVGGLRPYSWYKYLREFGLYPIVVTRQWSNKYGSQLDYISASQSSETEIEKTDYGTIIKASYKPNLSNRLLIRYGENKFKIIRRLITAYFELGQYLFNIGPRSSLYYAAIEYLKTNSVDFIIATGEPFVLFVYSSKISRKYNIPWIADYRDPWSQNKIRSNSGIVQKWNAFFEKKYLKNVSFITTVSTFIIKQIAGNISNKEFQIIQNGYNPEANDLVKDIIQANEKFSIAFVGTIYKWHPLESFLRVCCEFVIKNPDAKFRISFYGVNVENEIRSLIKSSYQHLIPVVCIYPKLSNEQLLQRLATENVFLLFNDYSILGTKIYDYLALKRKIVLCYSDDKEANQLRKKYYAIKEFDSESIHSQEDLINKTKSGVVARDAGHLRNLLEDFYSEFKVNGFITCNSVNTEQFSRKIQTQKLAELIHENISTKEIKYQQCTRCVMDTSDPEISFDDKGYCNHCNDYFENTSKRAYQGKISDIKLAGLVEKIIKSGKKNEYDCIIGVSGGVDSIYTAYLAKKLGLRPLAMHMDNGWNSELAVSNIEKVLKKLKIDLYTLVLDWEEFRDLQLAFLKASVPEAETPTDIAIPAALHKVAAKFNIKYVFSGGNFATEGILPKSWHYNAKDVKFLKAIHKKFATKKLKTFPTFEFRKEMYYKIVKGIKMIYPLNYISYNKQDAMKVLEQELDWKNYGGKHHESIYTKFIQSYILPEKFGIDYRRATFSTQICAGEITRDEALLELTKKPYDTIIVEEEKKYMCKKLCISADEFNKIMSLAPKTYKDYPNDKRKLEFIYKIYRTLN